MNPIFEKPPKAYFFTFRTQAPFFVKWGRVLPRENCTLYEGKWKLACCLRKKGVMHRCNAPWPQGKCDGGLLAASNNLFISWQNEERSALYVIYQIKIMKEHLQNLWFWRCSQSKLSDLMISELKEIWL